MRTVDRLKWRPVTIEVSSRPRSGLRRHWRVSWVSALAIAGALTVGCGGGAVTGEDPSLPPVALRVYHNPYGAVEWSTDHRLKAQLHDHPRVNVDRIRAYDEAGYDALILADYSGAPDRSYALKTRLWPPEAVLSANLLEGLRNIKFFIPGAEEVGLSDHFVSPFLTEYVERWNPAYAAEKRSWHYDSVLELVQLVRARDGLVIAAHPWTPGFTIEHVTGLSGTEVYSAYGEAMRRAGARDFVSVDRNELLLDSWDRALANNQALVGVAVNDHFGPLPDVPTDPDVRDSGKIIVLSKSATLDGFRQAFERRSVLAVKDLGVIKDHFPTIRSILVGASSISIDTAGAVRWISRGVQVGGEPTLQYSALPPGATYLRCEIENSEHSVVYTQAFKVRPVGDANGDGDVDADDKRVCEMVKSGDERDADRVAACS